MAEGVLLDIAKYVPKNLGSRALDKIASAWGFKARLEKPQEHDQQHQKHTI